MAETIKGINVVISANTTALSKALASVDKASKSIQSELKQVDKLLKLDPKSTELLVQKQKLLKDAVSGSKDKLNQLKEAQKQVNEQFRQGKISEGQYRAFQRETIKTKQELKNLESQLRKTAVASDRFSAAMRNAGEKMSSVGKTLSFAVTMPFVGIGAAATKMAMDAVESENLFEVSMGKMAGRARKWSEDISKSLGLNAFEVRKNIATFNVMLGSMGLTEKQAYDMSASMTKLAYDMASFYNLKPEEAFEKLRAGISGETEPLKVLGINLLDTQVKTYAFTHGIAQQGKEITEQQKIIARYGLLMETTKKAQGDLSRTIDSPTNKMRIMTQQVQQLGIKFGQILIPVLEQLIAIIKPVLDWFNKLSSTQQKLIITIVGIAAAVGPVLVVFGNLVTVIGSISPAIANVIPAITAMRTVIMGLNFTAILSPIGLVIIAITALAAAAYLVIKNWSKIKAFFIGLWTSITSIFTGAGEKIKTLLAGVWESVKTKAAIVWESLKTFLVNWWPYLIGALAGPVGLLAAFIYKNWDNIKAGTLKIWDNIKTGISNALGTIKTTIVSGLEKAWAYIKSIPAEAVSWGKEIVQGLIKGITQKFADLWKTIENIASGIKNRIKSALNIKSPSGIMEEFGRMVAEGLAQGIEESAPKVDKSAVGLTENLEAQFGKASNITGVSEGLLIAVGKIESGFNRLAKSSAGARGIMQIMPDTAAGLAKQLKIPTKNILTNSYENILAGATYLKQMMGMFDDNIQLALAAYNAGAGRVKSAIAKTGATAWDTVKKLLPKETQNYVDKVLGAMENLKTGYNNIVSNVKEANQKLVDAVKSTTDTMINKFDLLGSIAEKKSRILELTGGAVNIWDKFSAKKDLLTSQFSLIAKQVEVLTSAYNELAKVQGAGSTDALEMQNRLLDMQIKLLETKKELEAVSTQERRTKENTRLLEEAASIAGGKTVVNNVTVNNPKPETAGDSVRKELLRLQYMGALG